MINVPININLGDMPICAVGLLFLLTLALFGLATVIKNKFLSAAFFVAGMLAAVLLIFAAIQGYLQ